MANKLKEWFLENSSTPEKLELFLFFFDCMYSITAKKNASKEKALFLVSTQTLEELEEVAGRFHGWEDWKNSGILDLDKHDYEIADMLYVMYSLDQIWNWEVVQMNNYYFIFSKDDYWRFDKSVEYEIQKAIQSGYLTNPVFVEYDEDGNMLFD